MANENLLLTSKYKEIDISFLKEKEDTIFTPTKEEFNLILNCARLGKAYVSGKLYIFDNIIFVDNIYEGELQANGLYIFYAQDSVEFDFEEYAYASNLDYKQNKLYVHKIFINNELVCNLIVPSSSNINSVLLLKAFLNRSLSIFYEGGQFLSYRIEGQDDILRLFYIDAENLLDSAYYSISDELISDEVIPYDEF